MTEKTKLTFIGGLEDIGKNMLIVEQQQEAIIVDCGMSFPDEDMYGIDIVIPNFEYVRKIKNKIKAVIVTHGHEDHIGALGYLYKEIEAPLYGTNLTLAFAEEKLSGEQRKNIKRQKIQPGQIYTFGSIKIEPFNVCHSIPEGVGLIITTPNGTIVHSGDFKLDAKPIDGRSTDLPRLHKLRSADVLLCDSTNSDQPGKTIPESLVGKTFEKIFPKCQGRIIIASFSSNTFRIQHALNAAVKSGRRVAFLGRSMVNNFQIARDNGAIKCPAGTIFDIKNIKSIPDNKIVIITTGSQGEKMSALTHMAKRMYNDLVLKKSDTVIISATPIPGNEKNINATIDNLYKIGVELYYDKVEQIHASGHACSEEIRQFIRAVKPKYFIPVHGEYKHLLINSKIAISEGIKPKNIFILNNGRQIILDKNSCQEGEKVNGTPVCIDGRYYASPNENVFDERHILSRKGIVTVTAIVKNDQLQAEPQIQFYGFIYRNEIPSILPYLKTTINNILKDFSRKKINDEKEKDFQLKKELEKAIFEKLRRRPVVLANIVNV